MRAVFDVQGGGCAPPAPRPRVSRRARLALIFVVVVLAFGFGTLIAAGLQAFSDMQARGVMDGW
jgi:hypothetical protein